MARELKDKIIYVVEDSITIADMLSEWFRPQNTVLVSFSAEDALTKLEPAPPIDVFIIDYRLPQMNGVQFFEIIRPSYPQAKFIMISGEISLEMAANFQQVGFDALILKPFDLAILEKNILNLVAA